MKQHLAAVALVSLVLAGCDSQTSAELKTPAQKASYGIGLNMGKSLAQEGMDDLDSQAVAQTPSARKSRNSRTTSWLRRSPSCKSVPKSAWLP